MGIRKDVGLTFLGALFGSIISFTRDNLIALYENGFILGGIPINNVQAIVGLGATIGLTVIGIFAILRLIKYLENRKKLTVIYDEKNIKQYSPKENGHRVLRVRVKNRSDIDADDCEARLEAFDYDGIRVTEEKYLQWTKENDTKVKISKHDSVFLCVVFSTDNPIDNNIAFISTPQSSDFDKTPRTKDGLVIGNYKLLLRIKPPIFKEALYVKFDLEVNENWEEISMSKTDEFFRSE